MTNLFLVMELTMLNYNKWDIPFLELLVYDNEGFLLKRNQWYWPLLVRAKLFSNWIPKARKSPWGTESSVPHLSLREFVSCPVHCCCLSLSTSIPNLHSNVISVRCGVIASVCWWAARSNNYLNSPSGHVPKERVLTTAADVLTIHWQSLYDVINALLL